MRKIENALVVCVTVDGAHEPVRDAEFVVQDLDHGGETVRRATRVGNNLVLRGVIHAIIHADANRYVWIFSGCAD